MNNYIKFISMRAGNFSIALFIVMLCVSNSTMAQGDGARFYWKSLMGTNAIPVITNSLGGNANPFDPSNFVIPGSDFSATMSTGRLCKNAASIQTFGISFSNCSYGQNIK